MPSRAAIVLVVLAACGSDEEGKPPPIGPGSGPSTLGGSGIVDTSGTGSSSTGSSSSGSDSTADDGISGTGPPVETGSDTSCGDWAEVYVRCIGTEVGISVLEQQCDAELVEWEEPLPSCRVLAEELLVCVTQQPCQAFIDWEINRAIPAECAAELEALEQMCSFTGTSST